MNSRSNQDVRPVGNPSYTRLLWTGHARHAQEGEAFPLFRPDLDMEESLGGDKGQGYATYGKGSLGDISLGRFAGLDQAPSPAPTAAPMVAASSPSFASDPVSYLLNLFTSSPLLIGAAAVGIYFLLREKK